MRITLDSTIAVVVDVQERLLPVMYETEQTLAKIVTLIRGFRSLDVPLLVTEQYPKGLGPTVDDVVAALTDDGTFTPIVKSAFSCCDDDAFSAALSDTSRGRGSTVVVAGIEAHVCILQTTVDLIERGFDVVVVADATSSRSVFDRDIAFRRIEAEGARLTTVESLLFELTRVSGTPQFKTISKLVK